MDRFRFLRIALPVAAFGLSVATAHAAKGHRSVSPQAQAIANATADPMSPINPFNTGADPITMPGDARMVVFPYSRDQIYRIMTAPLKLTTLELAPGEKLVANAAEGDSIDWIIDTDGANHIFVKPIKPDLVNTLHLTTNYREYDLTLVSSPLGGLFYQVVRFHYPVDLMAKVRARDREMAGQQSDASVENSGPLGVSPSKLNFDYTISGSASFRPQAVFDDGKFIWIRIPDGAPFAVPIVKEHGDIVSPNFIRRGPYIVVQQLADKIVLRAGDDEVKITKGHRGFFGL